MSLAFLIHWADRFRGYLILISLLGIVNSGATLAIPWLVGQFLSGAIGAEAIDLTTTLTLLAAALLSLAVITITVRILSELASGKVLATLRNEIHAHVQALPMTFHDENAAGDLLALTAWEVQQLGTFLTKTLASLPSMMITGVGAAVLLFVLDPRLALFIPLLVPLCLIALKLFRGSMRRISQQRREAEVEVITLAESDLEMLSATKAFAVEEHHRSRYSAAVDKARRLGLKETIATAFAGPVVGLMAAGAVIATLLASESEIASGAKSPGDLFAILLYAALLTRPIGGLADTYSSFQVAKGTFARLQNVFEQDKEPGYEGGIRIERARGEIAFEAVSFAYPDRPWVLRQASLSIAAGQIVALTGPNGIGKSSLVSLLLGFYTPQQGRITLDGADIASFQVQDLRRQFGYVPQRPLLFDGTIIENITFGLAQADRDAVARVVMLAQARDFIADLPEGYETRIGDHGVRLSGGQRQRIALARALLRDPPIYILDEATSMYDLESEAAFVEQCIGALKDRTVILITHRPASLALADRVIDARKLAAGGDDKT